MNRSTKVITVICICAALFTVLIPGIFELLSGTSVVYGTSRFEKEATTLKNTVLARLFSQSGATEVLLGRDGWLYYSETLNDYTGAGTLSDGELEQLADKLLEVKRYCETRGAEFIVVVAPNKNTVYPDNMPARFSRGDRGTSNCERLLPKLEARGIDAPALAQLLTDRAARLAAAGDESGANGGADNTSGVTTCYYKTDTHWNALGASVCADWLIARLTDSEFSYAETGYTLNSAASAGDLYRLLYPTGSGVDTAVEFKEERVYSYTAGAPVTLMDLDISTQSTVNDTAVLVYRDSFGSELIPLLSNHFGRARYLRGSAPYDLTKIDDFRPDAVVLEIAERNIAQLLRSEFYGF